MFERFTERARQVVVLAQDEARTLKHNYIGTEHILLGLLREEDGLAARVLDSLGVTLDEVRAQVARIVGQGDQVTTGQIAFTPRTQKVLELALREALALGQKHVDTEHILLGLIRENEGVGARILLDFDADAEKVRDEVLRSLCKTDDMFERFTERARQVVVLAQDEARLLKHNYIGTEHILLGLLCEEEGLAARVLDTLDITVEEVRAQVVRIVGRGDEADTGQIPFTPRVKKVLELALQEALSLGHNYLGTEHILLGLVHENGGVGARILNDFDADPDKIRNELLRMLSGPGRRQEMGGSRRVVRQTHDAGPFLHADNRPAQLFVACPVCATPIETISMGQPNTTFTVEAEGDRDCAVCGARWTISYNVSWKARTD